MISSPTMRTSGEGGSALVIRHVAVGFLYHADSGRVLLHLRAADGPPSARRWAFFGGDSEPEAGDDLPATWCREMREELGVALDPASIVSLRHDTYADGSPWHEYDAAWPTPAEDFALTEGQRYGWFTLAAALALPDLAEHALGSVDASRERLACEHCVVVPPVDQL